MVLRRALLLAAVLATAAAGSALAATLLPSQVEAKFAADFAPTALSKRQQTPLSLRVGMDFRSVDGSPVPALEEFEIKEDRHVRLNLGGVPVCRPASHPDVPPIEVACRAAVCRNRRLVTGLDAAFVHGSSRSGAATASCAATG